MRKKEVLLLGSIWLSLLLGACAHISQGAVAQAKLETELIRSGISAQALGSAAGAAWAADGAKLESFLDKIDLSTLGAGDIASPKVDFARYGVLLLWMGRKPTGGYGIELMPEGSHIRGDTAFLAVRWIEPAKGDLVSQMITHPYLVVQIEKGRFYHIVVIDQQGQIRVKLDSL